MALTCDICIILTHFKIYLNTVQHPEHSWETCHPLKILKGLLSDQRISIWEP